MYASETGSYSKKNKLDTVLCSYYSNIESSDHSIRQTPYLFSTLIFLCLCFSLFAPAKADDLSVFGPETFLRESGSPVVVERSFTVTDLSALFRLQISNGNLQDDTSTTDLVSSSEIYLNDLKVVGEQNFNQNIDALTIPITLQAFNTLSVELRGKPGGQLTIAIIKNQIPLANAGPDQTTFIGDLVQLSGSGSTDANGDPLSYQWEILSKPVNSQAILSDSTAIMPTLTIDQAGPYTLALTVNDGYQDSLTDQVIIDTGNIAPIAQAGL